MLPLGLLYYYDCTIKDSTSHIRRQRESAHNYRQALNLDPLGYLLPYFCVLKFVLRLFSERCYFVHFLVSHPAGRHTLRSMLGRFNVAALNKIGGLTAVLGGDVCICADWFLIRRPAGHARRMGHPGLPEPKSCCRPACLSGSVLCTELASPWVGGGQRLLASGMPITAFCSLMKVERDVRRNTHRGFVCGGSRGGSVVVLCTPGRTGRRTLAAGGLVGSPTTLRTGSENSLIDWEGKGAGSSRAHHISNNTYVH